MARLEPSDVTFFASPAELRAWLEANHATAAERWVGFRPKGSGLPTITWHELVDEVLCYGWIDSVIDAGRGRVAIRITPRRSGSIWSARNVGRVEALRVEGRMRPAGEAAFALRRDDRTAVYSFENDAELDDVSRRRPARAAGRHRVLGGAAVGLPPLRRALDRGAKRAETRARRLALLVEGCARGERLVALTGKARAQKA